MIIGRNGDRANAIINRFIACQVRKTAVEIGLLDRSEYPACLPGKNGRCTLCGTGDCLRRPS